MNANCSRCDQKIEDASFIFYEVDGQDRKHRFGTFCFHCTIELLDQLKGKVEWFYIGKSWKGYIHPEAKAELEKIGFIHPKRNTQYIEISQVGRKRGRVEGTDTLAILRLKYAGGLISKEEYERLLKKLREAGHEFS